MREILYGKCLYPFISIFRFFKNFCSCLMSPIKKRTADDMAKDGKFLSIQLKIDSYNKSLYILLHDTFKEFNQKYDSYETIHVSLFLFFANR